MNKVAASIPLLFLSSLTPMAQATDEIPPQTKKLNQELKPKLAAIGRDKYADLAGQLEELRNALKAQQEEIQQLKKELAKRDQRINEVHDAAAMANTKAVEAEGKASEAVGAAARVASTSVELNSSLVQIKLTNETVRTTVAEDRKMLKAAETPATIHFKGVTLTPGGYFAADTIFRSHALSSDLGTQFASIPYPGNSLAKISELNFTGRSSRPSMLVEGSLDHFKFSGYVEADFLGVGTTSNNRQSNSYALRLRLAFAQVAMDKGWTLAGGQMWTLAAENKKGLWNRQEAFTMQIDPSYMVGFTLQRAYGLRLWKNWSDKFALGVSIEGPQATLGGRGFSTFTPATGNPSQNFFINAPGASGGAYNAFDSTGYSLNKAPDLLFKAAGDLRWGHYELFGIVSAFRNRIFPCAVVSSDAVGVVTASSGTKTTYTGAPITCAADPTASAPSIAGARNDSRTGGGFGASFNVPLFSKKLDFGIKAVAGDGIGRFAAAQLPDATARPDGTLALIRDEYSLARLEFHVTPKLDVYVYGGNEYAWRAAYTGYQSVKVTTTLISNPNGVPGAPVLTNTTVTRSIAGIGGYGSPFADNSGCSAEITPSGSSSPGAGKTCAGDIRNIMQFTVGFWRNFYQGSKGRLRFGIQYSYLTKSGWSGSNVSPTGGTSGPGISPKALDNMLWTSFRYYLP